MLSQIMTKDQHNQTSSPRYMSQIHLHNLTQVLTKTANPALSQTHGKTPPHKETKCTTCFGSTCFCWLTFLVKSWNSSELADCLSGLFLHFPVMFLRTSILFCIVCITSSLESKPYLTPVPFICRHETPHYLLRKRLTVTKTGLTSVQYNIWKSWNLASLHFISALIKATVFHKKTTFYVNFSKTCC